MIVKFQKANNKYQISLKFKISMIQTFSINPPDFFNALRPGDFA